MVINILKQLAKNEVALGIVVLLVIVEFFVSIFLFVKIVGISKKIKSNQVVPAKTNKKREDHIQKIKMLFSFPHIWICGVLVLVSIIAIYISWKLQDSDSFISSIFANIFAGLVTGLAICLISGVKQISILQMQGKRAWLVELAQMLKIYLGDYHKLIQYKFDKFNGNHDDFIFFYDMSIHASDINAFVAQSSFNKTLAFNPHKYSLSNLGYDAAKMGEKFDLLHEKVEMIEIDLPSSRAIEGYFKEIHPDLRKLNSAVYSAIRDLDVRLSDIQKTII